MVQIVGALPEGSTFSDIYNKDFGKDLAGAGRQFTQGLSFSSSDEIEAFMRSVLGDKSYSDNLDQIRAELKKFDEENPEASTAGFFPVKKADPKVGTGKKPKGSKRRLYTDENPKDTVRIKFATPTVFLASVGVAKSQSHG